MRLWSIHPKYLDAKGVVALWREGLLAKNVLEGNTKGYKNHPQLIRFKNLNNPVININNYLNYILQESKIRGYNFNKNKLNDISKVEKIKVTNLQIKYEFDHLLKKLKIRDENLYNKFKNIKKIELHPMFKKIKGEIAEWEIVK